MLVGLNILYKSFFKKPLTIIKNQFYPGHQDQRPTSHHKNEYARQLQQRALSRGKGGPPINKVNFSKQKHFISSQSSLIELFLSGTPIKSGHCSIKFIILQNFLKKKRKSIKIKIRN